MRAEKGKANVFSKRGTELCEWIDGLRAEVEAKLRVAGAEGVARARRSGRVELCCLRVALPQNLAGQDALALFEAATGCERFYWERAAASHLAVGLGAVRVIEVRGPDRFREASRRARELFDRIELLETAKTRRVGDGPPLGAGPLLVGGFAFAPDGRESPEWRGYPAGRLVLPELLVVRSGGRLWCTLSLALATGSDPAREAARVVERCTRWLAPLTGCSAGGSSDSCGFSGFEAAGVVGLSPGPEYSVRSDRSHADFRAQVQSARDAIALGELEKVVLARSLHVRHDGRLEIGSLLRRLRGLYPTCATFAVGRPGSCFLGATPELLVELSRDRVATGAVAGSAPRGLSPDEDERLGRALRESKKEQQEHAVVVRALCEALDEVCCELSVPEAPRLLRIEGIQHLETAISGKLRGNRKPSILDLVGRLHPTPAVGGAPAAAALEWIERCEGLDRGWYAGPVGMVDSEGGGEFRVALRSGLVREGAGGDEALLFAGAGIVADSEPKCELEETRIKLRALLAPLTEI